MILAGVTAFSALVVPIVKPGLKGGTTDSGVTMPAYVISFSSVFITLISGIFILRGHNWARWLYINWSIFSIMYAAANVGLSARLLPSVIFVLVMGLLITVGAGNYFQKSGHANG